MMRRALILLLLWPSLALGAGLSTWNGSAISGQKYHGATLSSWCGADWSACDDCSGTLSWSHHFEADDLTSGSPCGCRDGAVSTSITHNNSALSTTQKSDGAKSLYYAGANDYASFTLDSSTFNASDGTVTFDWYPVACAASTLLFNASYNTDNRLRIYGTANCSVNLFFVSGGTSKAVYAGATKSDEAWYRVTAKWKTGVAGNDMLVQICDLNVGTQETSNCVGSPGDLDISSLAGQPATGMAGNADSAAVSGYIDRLRITSGDSGF